MVYSSFPLFFLLLIAALVFSQKKKKGRTLSVLTLHSCVCILFVVISFFKKSLSDLMEVQSPLTAIWYPAKIEPHFCCSGVYSKRIQKSIMLVTEGVSFFFLLQSSTEFGDEIICITGRNNKVEPVQVIMNYGGTRITVPQQFTYSENPTVTKFLPVNSFSR